MKTPGITVRPIQTIDGGVEVNEVWFDDVRVPVENLVGEENKGWDYAKFLLGNERTGIARVGVSKARIRRIKQLAALERVGDTPMIDEPHFREKVAAGRGGAEGAGDDPAPRRRRRAQARARQAEPGQLHPEDQGIRVAAGHDRAADGRRRALYPAL